MNNRLRIIGSLLLASLAIGASSAWAQAGPPSVAPDASVSPVPPAERIYAEARPRLLQVRTLVAAAGRQSTIGSGFLVSADGLAVTNYHVVSQYALEPGTYRLEYTAADGTRGTVTLLAIDVANDLAVIRLDNAWARADVERAFLGAPRGRVSCVGRHELSHRGRSARAIECSRAVIVEYRSPVGVAE